MNKFKIQVDQTLRQTFEFVVESELDIDELDTLLSGLERSYEFRECHPSDIGYMLEKNCCCNVIEHIEQDPEVDENEILDLTEVK